MTLGFNLISLIIVFSINLQPREKVQNLEDDDMIESINDLSLVVIVINNYMPYFLGSIIPLTLILLKIFKANSIYKKNS